MDIAAFASGRAFSAQYLGSLMHDFHAAVIRSLRRS